MTTLDEAIAEVTEPSPALQSSINEMLRDVNNSKLAIKLLGEMILQLLPLGVSELAMSVFAAGIQVGMNMEKAQAGS